MIKNYFKIAWRNLWKNKISSVINILGLAIGMAACIVIVLFVSYEKSFDNFHADNIYRLNEVQTFPGMVASQKVGLSMFPMAPALKSEFPEVQSYTRIRWDRKYQLTYADKKLFLPQVFAVDSTFLKIFNFKVIRGDGQRAIEKPNQILLTEETAEKLFGNEDPIGKVINHYGGDTEFKYGNNPRRELGLTQLIVDNDYLNLYNILLVAGKNFSNAESANGRESIINESLAKELLKDYPGAKTESLIGCHFGVDSLGVIIGIAKNFNFNSLHYKVETMYMLNQKHWGFNVVSVKTQAGKEKEALSFVEDTWKKLNPDHPFEYQFLDDHFKEVYRADDQVSKIVGILAVLAIIISCLGLFGLATFSAEKRIKEIGIRKVLGASVQNIVVLLSSHFIKLVILSNLIAWPLAWLVMNDWLNDFAFHIRIDWSVFVFVGLLSVFIALFTISFQAIKTAIANPAKSLKSQ